MFLVKKLIFKFMELGLGLKTYFSLETKNPIFINFKLTPEEVDKIQSQLPPGFTIQRVRFTHLDENPHYWISYNFYELKYPKPELASVKKARLEINTFVQDAQGRKGIFVFCGSPFVSVENRWTVLGSICDFAEWLVTKIYGVGRLVPIQFNVGDKLKVGFKSSVHSVNIEADIQESNPQDKSRLSRDYWEFNDISFFNQGKTCDYVNVNSSFYSAEFFKVNMEQVTEPCVSPFFKRVPDEIWVHRGEISYLVNSMNRCRPAEWVHG